MFVNWSYNVVSTAFRLLLRRNLRTRHPLKFPQLQVRLFMKSLHQSMHETFLAELISPNYITEFEYSKLKGFGRSRISCNGRRSPEMRTPAENNISKPVRWLNCGSSPLVSWKRQKLLISILVLHSGANVCFVIVVRCLLQRCCGVLGLEGVFE